MIVLEKCVFCKHHTYTDKSVLGHFKSFCKAFPDGEGIPNQVMDLDYDVECGNGYKFEPRDEWKDKFQQNIIKERTTMSIIGDKIHRIRDFRGMTQKQLGMAVGFDEKSADVRIAQYESGTRTPKQALVEQLAEVLDVNPRFLADDEILGAEGVMMMLFELDEHYPISIEDCEDEDGNRRKGIVFGSILMTDLLSEWQRRKKDLADGKISKAEYTEWKLNWPKTTDDCGKHEPAKEWRNI